jgi:RNA recognition motif-containing protein
MGGHDEVDNSLNCRVYFSGMPADTTEDEVRELFSGIGVIGRIRQKRGYKDQVSVCVVPLDFDYVLGVPQDQRRRLQRPQLSIQLRAHTPFTPDPPYPVPYTCVQHALLAGLMGNRKQVNSKIRACLVVQWPWAIKMYKDKDNKLKGDGTVTYEDPAAANSAPDFFNNHEVRGQKMTVEMATMSETRPEPAPGGGRGGGFGGRGGGGGELPGGH